MECMDMSVQMVWNICIGIIGRRGCQFVHFEALVHFLFRESPVTSPERTAQGRYGDKYAPGQETHDKEAQAQKNCNRGLHIMLFRLGPP